MSRSPILGFLGRYGSELALQGVAGWRLRRRILGEAEAHLRDATRWLERAGLDREAAEEQAIRRFGEAGQLARLWSVACEAADLPLRGLDWAVRSAAAMALGLMAALFLGGRWDDGFGGELLFAGAALLMGGCLGVGQWLLLRPRRLAGRAWIAASAAGVCVGLPATTFLVEASGFSRDAVLIQQLAALVLIGGGTGAVVGALQQLSLRASRAGRGDWVLRSAVGMGLGTALGGLAAEVALGGFRSEAGYLLVCIAAALATGLSTVGGLRNPLPAGSRILGA